MGKVVEKHQLEKTILQRREQGLLGSMETKDSHELESKKKSTLVQNRRRQNDQRRDMNADRWKTCKEYTSKYRKMATETL